MISCYQSYFCDKQSLSLINLMCIMIVFQINDQTNKSYKKILKRNHNHKNFLVYETFVYDYFGY